MSEFVKQENESNYQFIKRMVHAKDDGVFSGTYSDWIEAVFGKTHSEDVARREYYGCRLFVSFVGEDEEEQFRSDNTNFLEELQKRELEIDKKRMKLSDEFIYVNKLKREIARTETIGEYAAMAAQIVKQTVPFIALPATEKEPGQNKAVLCISDWHYGLEVMNALNVFNPNVAKQRLQLLLNAVAKDIEKFDIDEIVVANLGDLISGIIHTTIRLENRIDVITQTIEVSELLAELLFELSKFVKVRYYSVVDNHGRVFANKHDNLDIENFGRMIDFYLKERFRDVPEVEICDNEIDETIMHFSLNGWAFVGTHGHDDNPNTALNDLSNLLHIDYNVCLLGHRHSPSLSESYGDLTISNGCLCGIDTYAKNIRKASRPSQNLIIVSESNPCEFLHTINLNGRL